MNVERGNVTFVSNLYPVENRMLHNDKNFCQHIEDSKRLYELRKNSLFKYFPWTNRQESIFHIQCGFSCKISPEDKPFGAIECSDGLIREVCKCTKKDCPHFSECIECNL